MHQIRRLRTDERVLEPGMMKHVFVEDFYSFYNFYLAIFTLKKVAFFGQV